MFGKVKVRKLTEEEVRERDAGTVVYIESDDFEPDSEENEHGLVLVEARITDPAAEGGYWPVRDIFGKSGQRSVKHSGIYVGDEKGEVANLVRQAGAHLDLSLIFPNIGEEEVRNRVFKALREEFGAGLIWIIREAVTPVSAVKYDVLEKVTVSTGRGKSRETNVVINQLAEDVYRPQAEQVKPQSGGRIDIVVHRPKRPQMRTI